MKASPRSDMNLELGAGSGPTELELGPLRLSAIVPARDLMNVAYDPSAGSAWVVNSTTFAPVSRPMAWAVAGDVPSSVKTDVTPSARILASRAARSADEVSAWSVSP